MKLSEADTRVIQRLGKNEETWVSARWAALFIGLVLLFGSVFIFREIWNTVAFDHILLMLCLLVAPVAGIAFFVGVAALFVACRREGKLSRPLAQTSCKRSINHVSETQ